MLDRLIAVKLAVRLAVGELLYLFQLFIMA